MMCSWQQIHDKCFYDKQTTHDNTLEHISFINSIAIANMWMIFTKKNIYTYAECKQKHMLTIEY